MSIDYKRLKSWPFEDQLTPYTRKDCALYALGLGYADDPLDEDELAFVYEHGLKTVPSMFTVLGAPGAWASDPGTGIEWMKILHGEHRMTLHGAPPPEGCLRSHTRVSSVIDKGEGRGALVITTREITDESSGKLLATIDHTSFCRADGGFGSGDAAPPMLPGAPDAPAEATVALPTSAACGVAIPIEWRPQSDSRESGSSQKRWLRPPHLARTLHVRHGSTCRSARILRQ